MKRDFLKNLGIEDKELIDKILDENSADIGKAKGELENYKNKVTELEESIKSKDTEIETLTKEKGNVEELNNKIKDLESENTKLKTDLDTEVSKLTKTHAIENGVRDAKAKNVKSVIALLDLDKITMENGELKGLSEQLDTLTKGEDTSFLFGNTDGNPPAGANPHNPPGNPGGTPPTSMNLGDAIAKALSK
jgi:predicted nuclease with TOPRIM domain